MISRRLLLTLGLSMASLVASLPAEEVHWTQELLMEAQPNQELSRWLKAGDGQSTLEEAGLVLDTSEGEAMYWRIEGQENDGDWDGSRPTTIEFEARARDISGGMDAAAQVVASDGMNYYAFNVADSEWHTYRIVLSGGQAMLYTDGELGSEEVLEAKRFPEGLGKNQIYFGDGGGSVGGISEWKSFRWTNEGAFSP